MTVPGFKTDPEDCLSNRTAIVNYGMVQVCKIPDQVQAYTKACFSFTIVELVLIVPVKKPVTSFGWYLRTVISNLYIDSTLQIPRQEQISKH
jgi:hypothetical protein